MLLVEENDAPLSFGVDGANQHDSILLDILLHDRFQSFEPLRYALNLCLDIGFACKDNWSQIMDLFHTFADDAKRNKC